MAINHSLMLDSRGSRFAMRGSSEASDARMLLGDRSHLRVGSLVRIMEANRARQDRRRVMEACKAREDHRRAFERVSPFEPMTPLAAIVADIKAGTLPRMTEWKTTTRRYLDREKQDRHYHSVTEQALGSIVALERLYRDYVSERAMAASVMSHEQSHDGRGASSVRIPSSVSAMQTRVTATPRIADSFDARPAKDRGSARPYSRAQFNRDVSYGKTRAMSDCVSVRIGGLARMDRGFAHLVATERILRGHCETFVAPAKEREGRKDRKLAASPQNRASRDRELAARIIGTDIAAMAES